MSPFEAEEPCPFLGEPLRFLTFSRNFINRYLSQIVINLTKLSEISLLTRNEDWIKKIVEYFTPSWGSSFPLFMKHAISQPITNRSLTNFQRLSSIYVIWNWQKKRKYYPISGHPTSPYSKFIKIHDISVNYWWLLMQIFRSILLTLRRRLGKQFEISNHPPGQPHPQNL